jgi:hypothetical protein
MSGTETEIRHDGTENTGSLFSRAAASGTGRYRVQICIAIAVVMAAVLGLALAEFFVSDLARRSFVFYNIDSGEIIVEQRMLRNAGSPEDDIIRYVEEALLGPFSRDAQLLFPRGTRLRSLLYRDGTVFVNLSSEAVMPVDVSAGSLRSFRTLNSGITRNFPSVGEVRFFIEGRAAFAGEFVRQ